MLLLKNSELKTFNARSIHSITLHDDILYLDYITKKEKMAQLVFTEICDADEFFCHTLEGYECGQFNHYLLNVFLETASIYILSHIPNAETGFGVLHNINFGRYVIARSIEIIKSFNNASYQLIDFSNINKYYDENSIEKKIYKIDAIYKDNNGLFQVIADDTLKKSIFSLSEICNEKTFIDNLCPLDAFSLGLFSKCNTEKTVNFINIMHNVCKKDKNNILKLAFKKEFGIKTTFSNDSCVIDLILKDGQYFKTVTWELLLNDPTIIFGLKSIYAFNLGYLMGSEPS